MGEVPETSERYSTPYVGKLWGRRKTERGGGCVWWAGSDGLQWGWGWGPELSVALEARAAMTGKIGRH